jgi:hypothetical protein
MRIAVIFAVSALLAAESGRAEAASTCISKATEALPRISGLVNGDGPATERHASA